MQYFNSIARIIKIKFYVQKRRIKAILRLLILPGFDDVPLYDVLVFFIRGIFKGAVTTRAAAVAFNFFLAIFPFILFLFTLIPYLQIEDFQATLLDLFKDIIPPNTYNEVEETILEIVLRQNTGLLSLSFILTFIFSTNASVRLWTDSMAPGTQLTPRPGYNSDFLRFFLMLVLSFFCNSGHRANHQRRTNNKLAYRKAIY